MIIQELEEKVNFSEIECGIADFILQNGEKIKSTSIQKLAEDTYSSPATIVRLCKKLGMKGYQEFRIRFNAEYEEDRRLRKKVNANIPFQKTDSYEVIVSNLGNLVINSIQDTMRRIDLSHMGRIMNRMTRAREFYVFGEGTSLLSALDFKTKMLRLGKIIYLEETWTHQQALAINAREDSFSIAVSYSGETQIVVNTVRLLKEKHRYILAITSERDSTLARMANDTLLIDSNEGKFLGNKLESFTSYNSVHFILDCLYSFYFLKDYDHNVDILQKNANKIRSI